MTGQEEYLKKIMLLNKSLLENAVTKLEEVSRILDLVATERYTESDRRMLSETIANLNANTQTIKEFTNPVAEII